MVNFASVENLFIFKLHVPTLEFSSRVFVILAHTIPFSNDIRNKKKRVKICWPYNNNVL